MLKGDLVQYWFDTGAFGAKILFGVVIKAGPKAFTVRWESGIQNRIRQDHHKGVELITDKDLLAEVRPDMRAESERLKGTA